MGQSHGAAFDTPSYSCQWRPNWRRIRKTKRRRRRRRRRRRKMKWKTRKRMIEREELINGRYQ